IANEGRLVAGGAPGRAEAALPALRATPRGEGGGGNGEGRTEPPRVGPGGTGLRRQPGHGRPGRGPPAPNLSRQGGGGVATQPLEFVPNQHATEAVTAHVIWMTTGLSCDGDSVAMTSATSPSLEDIVLGTIPGMPRVIVHNPVLAFENGAEFMQAWFDAEAGKLDPFVLVLEGSVPNEKINGEGHGAAMGTDPSTGQPITTNEWLDRLAPKAAAVVALGTCATYGGIPAMQNNPTGAMGLLDYLGWNWRSKAGLPVVCIPGCPAQPDNTTETLMYLVFCLAGMAPPPDLDEAHRPRWLFARSVHESCNRAGFYA